jgi:diphthamide biosynthesis enzyme Dph1/Dph2-like protein
MEGKLIRLIFIKVALQFPDAHLCDSARVAQLLEEKVNCKTYILADTSYGRYAYESLINKFIVTD